MNIESIGTVNREENGFSIHLEKKFVTGLKGLEGFSHLQIIWWAHLTDSEKARMSLVFDERILK